MSVAHCAGEKGEEMVREGGEKEKIMKHAKEADEDGGKSLFVESLRGSHQCVRRKGVMIQRIVLTLVSLYSRR